MDIINKRIVITGGTSGIGFELVKHLHKYNEVIVISKCQTKLNNLANVCQGVFVYQADLSEPEALVPVVNQIVQRFDRIDILINNAAVQYTPCMRDKDFCFESIAREIQINFASICTLSYLFLRALEHNNEAIIMNVNSALALTPKKSAAVYCATKGALNLFTRSLRYQLEQTNISVQQVFLELVDTAMTKGREVNKISPDFAARQIISGMERGVKDHYLGKVKLLHLLLRFTPSLAYNILKHS